MGNTILVETIIKDTKEILELTSDFINHEKIPGVYIELALSKVKNLHLELQMLNKADGDLEFIDAVPQPKKQTPISAPTVEKVIPQKKTQPPVEVEAPKAKQVVEKVKPPKKEKYIVEETKQKSTQPVVQQPVQEVQNGTILADKFKDDKKSLNETLSKQVKKKSLASQFEYKAIEDIRKAINLNSKIMFIKELFAGNANEYNQAIETLNNFDNLDQAMDYIAKSMNYDPENNTFMDFLEIIYLIIIFTFKVLK